MKNNKAYANLIVDIFNALWREAEPYAKKIQQGRQLTEDDVDQMLHNAEFFAVRHDEFDDKRTEIEGLCYEIGMAAADFFEIVAMVAAQTGMLSTKKYMDEIPGQINMVS